MKIAFIVQRYGAEILGGSEYHCRLVAEHLSRDSGHRVEVLTTCAREYTTWENAYPEGADRVRGVTVRRFANARTRDLKSFNAYSDWIFNNTHSDDDERKWLEQQGPWCPALIDYIREHHASYDALIFFTYLYAPTVLGLRIAPERSILVPTAHDEPAIRLRMYRDVFSRPAGIAFNTAVERGFLQRLFSVSAKAEDIVGCGVDLPSFAEFPPELSSTAADGDPGDVKEGASDEEADSGDSIEAETPDDDSGVLTSLQERGAVFRRRHRLFGPLALYGGRIDPGKGCEELIEYFSTYTAEHNDVTLALMGVKLMPIPDVPSIRFAGMLSEIERLEALEAANVVIVPSPYESLSLLALEAFAVGTPVLVNARSDVLTDHCQRSNAGLYYANREEFVSCLQLLMTNADLRTALGRNGRKYVRSQYSWDVILTKYDRLLSAVTGGRSSGNSNRSSRGRGRRPPRKKASRSPRRR